MKFKKLDEHKLDEHLDKEKSAINEHTFYRIIIEKLGISVFEWDLINNTFYSSEKYKNYYISKHFQKNIYDNKIYPDIVFPDDNPNFTKFLAITQSGKSFAETTIRLKMIDGSYRWTHIQCYIIYNENDKHIKTIGTLHDIHDEKKAEITSRLNRHLISTIINELDIHYWKYDITNKSTVYSKKAQNSFNISSDIDNYPKSLLKNINTSNKYKKEYETIIKKIENGAENAKMDYPVISSSGEVKWKRISYHTIFENGKPSKAIGTVVNITPNSILNNNYEEFSNIGKRILPKYISSFIISLSKNEETITSIIKKQLQLDNYSNNPLYNKESDNEKIDIVLNLIKNDIQMILKKIMCISKIASKTTAQNYNINKSLNIIETKSNLLIQMIKDILDIRLMKNGKYTFKSQPFSISELFQKAENTFTPIFKKERQNFSTKKRYLIHDCLLGDFKQISKILNYLLSNASKFTPSGGKIILSVKELPSPVKKIAYFCFSIKDNGIGIKKEELSLVFKPFYKTNESFNNSNEKGMGLTIVTAITRAMGGSVKITSEKNGGTKVAVYLPLLINSD